MADVFYRRIDGYVRIWSTEAIYNTGNPEFAGKPKQLASMSNHSGTIHTVRFSPNGKYLASGADDKIVCVYTLDANPPTHSSTFGRLLECATGTGTNGGWNAQAQMRPLPWRTGVRLDD